jgi:hypothetical protein
MNTTIAPFRLDGAPLRLDGNRPKSEVEYSTSAQDLDEVANKALRLLEEEDDGAFITFGDGDEWVLIYDETVGWHMTPLDFFPPEVL